MFRKYFVLVSVIVAGSFLISGCATAGRKSGLENQGLKNQVAVLENSLKEKEQENNALREALNRAEQKSAVAEARVVPEVKSHPTVKNIQTALKNAGYDIGVIDGKMGSKTRKAIEAFQKANNLKPDGKVGKKTWEILGTYLEKK